MPQLVFIPGLLLTSDLFSAQADALRNAYDIRHADTTGMDRITAMAERILDGIEGNFTPIGLSMGGYVTLELARLAPDRLDAMVVLDSSAATDGEERAESRKALIRMSRLGKFRGVTRTLLPSLVAPQHLEDEKLCRKIMEMAAAVGQENFVLQQQAIMARRDQFDTLRAFGKPALFIVGDSDLLTPPVQTAAMADAARGGEYLEIPDTGHLAPMESPDATTAGLDGFLKRVYRRALSP